MGILNTHQILKGARTPIPYKSHVIGGLTRRPTTTINGVTATQLDFAGGEIEFDGFKFPLPTAFDFASVAGVVKINTRYQIAAVPAYLEPIDRTAAASAGTNYFVSTTNNLDSVAYFFVDSVLEAAVAAEGGYENLTDVVLKGSPTAAQTMLFNSYEQALQRIVDPRYVSSLMKPNGVRFILAEIFPQDNSTAADKLEGMSVADFNKLRGVVDLYLERRVYSRVNGIARYETGARVHKMAKAFKYASQANADADISGTAIPVTGATPVTTGTAAGEFIAVFEYTYPSYMPLGQQGNQPKILNILTNQDDADLGRINPIYFGNNLATAKMPVNPLPLLTNYADPVGLVEVVLNGSKAPTPGSIVETYDMLIG